MVFDVETTYFVQPDEFLLSKACFAYAYQQLIATPFASVTVSGAFIPILSIVKVPQASVATGVAVKV
ncbi:hypothetical protein CRENPOLYSF2_2180005 [Crenothrix polyspora]|uniref:Uncharacterized protein n=1 Tax=Crenothrix polyspora TaxID=360316 RepID=A0A1R4H5L4_9GAMM|nr:hypothetical protein CRENPOLYSF2_2180005 [Crenothrix polyspora]